LSVAQPVLSFKHCLNKLSCQLFSAFLTAGAYNLLAAGGGNSGTPTMHALAFSGFGLVGSFRHIALNLSVIGKICKENPARDAYACCRVGLVAKCLVYV
jgi:hypothetical protein